MSRPEERLPRAVYSASQVRELDRIAIEERGVPSYTLMSRAAEAALRVLRKRWPSARRMLVVCGAGNNAGDGYVLARLAAAAGLRAYVLPLVPRGALKADAGRAYDDCTAAGLAVETYEESCDPATFGADVIVDALCGTGLDRPLEGAFARIADWINAARVPVLALDVPSGLHADTGLALGRAVRASVTVTFIGLKQGLFLGDAAEHRGVLEFDDLGVPEDVASAMQPAFERVTAVDLAAALPRRSRSAHKGTHGRLLVIGGGPAMAGAVRLTAEGALRAGAGLVDVATHGDSVGTVMAGRPEIICHALADANELLGLLAMADGAVVGPGLGRSEWSRRLVSAAFASELPLVVDADALNMLAESPSRRGRWVLTPHPGEAGRLLGVTAAEVQRDRLATARELAARYDAVAVLKGAGTLVATPDGRVLVCDRGNPGMAVAGMGDVLAGILGALLVQTRALEMSARAGVLLHALAGDAAAEPGERGMLASDLMPHVRRWANPS